MELAGFLLVGVDLSLRCHVHFGLVLPWVWVPVQAAAHSLHRTANGQLRASIVKVTVPIGSQSVILDLLRGQLNCGIPSCRVEAAQVSLALVGAGESALKVGISWVRDNMREVDRGHSSNAFLVEKLHVAELFDGNVASLVDLAPRGLFWADAAVFFFLDKTGNPLAELECLQRVMLSHLLVRNVAGVSNLKLALNAPQILVKIKRSLYDNLFSGLRHIFHLLSGLGWDLKHVTERDDVGVQLSDGDGRVLKRINLGVSHDQQVLSNPLAFCLGSDLNGFECVRHVTVFDQWFQAQADCSVAHDLVLVAGLLGFLVTDGLGRVFGVLEHGQLLGRTVTEGVAGTGDDDEGALVVRALIKDLGAWIEYFLGKTVIELGFETLREVAIPIEPFHKV